MSSKNACVAVALKGLHNSKNTFAKLEIKRGNGNKEFRHISPVLELQNVGYGDTITCIFGVVRLQFFGLIDFQTEIHSMPNGNQRKQIILTQENVNQLRAEHRRLHGQVIPMTFEGEPNKNIAGGSSR